MKQTKQDRTNWFRGTRVKRKRDIIRWSFVNIRSSPKHLMFLRNAKFLQISEGGIPAFDFFKKTIIKDIRNQAQGGTRHFTNGENPDIWVYLIDENIEKHGERVEKFLYKHLINKIKPLKIKKKRIVKQRKLIFGRTRTGEQREARRIIIKRISTKGKSYKQKIFRDVKTGRFLRRVK